MALAREGREAAFEEIVRRYRPGLVAFAAAYAPPDRAEDVVQESLVRSWEALGKGTQEIHLKPWLYTIVRNRALNARRDAKPHEPLSDQIDGVPQPPEIVLGREQLDSVVGAVGALPEPQRQALVRSALEGHTHEQIAAALGATPGAVRQLIYRARLNLRTGVGMMIPLPLVRLLVEHGTETAAATGMAAGGAAIGAAGGASVLTKFATVAAIGTLATGAGVAIDRANHDDGRRGAPIAAQEPRNGRAVDSARSQTGVAAATADDSADQDSGDSSGRGSAEDRSDESSGDNSGPGSGDADSSAGDSSGPSVSSGSSSEGSGEDRSDDSGGSDSSGPGPADGDDDPPEIDDDHSGPGGGGSGSSGSGSSGSGSSGSGSGSDDPPELPEPPEDDSSGSGSSGSGSSGSGGGGGDDPPDPLEPPDDD